MSLDAGRLTERRGHPWAAGMAEREVWGQQLRTSRTSPCWALSLGSSCLGAGACICRHGAKARKVLSEASCSENSHPFPSPAAPSASAGVLDAEWIFYYLPWLLFHISASWPLATFLVPGPLLSWIWPPSLVLTLGHSTNFENFLTFKPYLCFFCPSVSSSAQLPE